MYSENALRCPDGHSHLDCLRADIPLFGEVFLPDAAPCIDQYRTIESQIAGHNCSQGGQI